MLQDLWTFASPAIVEVSLQHQVLEPAALKGLAMQLEVEPALILRSKVAEAPI